MPKRFKCDHCGYEEGPSLGKIVWITCDRCAKKQFLAQLKSKYGD